MAEENIKPLNGLYNKLRNNGAQLPNEYTQFENAFTKPGKAGAENRHKLYNQMAKDGLTDGDDYSTWYTTYFQPVSKTSSKAREAGTPMTITERNNMMAKTAGMMYANKASADRANKQMARTKANTGLDTRTPKLGENRHVTEMETGGWDMDKAAPETTYVTESGNEYNQRTGADLEQNAIDEARMQNEQTETYLKQKQARLTEDLDKRAEEIDKKVDAEDGSNWFTNIIKELATGGNPQKIRDVREGKYNLARSQDTQYTSLKASLAQVDEALDTIKEGKKGKASDEWIEDSSNWFSKAGKNILAFGAGAGRGFLNTVGKVSTWDSGASDFANNAAIRQASDKAGDKGENMDELPEEQRDLLNLAALNQKVQADNEEYIGHGYKAGQVTGEMAPFMAEMALNPLSGTGKTAMKMVMKEAIKKYGKDAIRRNIGKYMAAKIGTRVLGDALGAVGMSLTTGLQKVAADAEQRMTGDIQYGYGDGGKVIFAGTKGKESAGRAYLKALTANSIENQSEMVSGYFSPFLRGAGKLLAKGLPKVTVERVGKFIDSVGSSDFARMISNFESKAKWHGSLSEYCEEVVGNVENALLVGDQTLDTAKGTGVFNGEQNLDTFLGVTLLGGSISAAKTLGYRGAKRETANKIASMGKQIDKVFAGNIQAQNWWGGIRNTLMVGTAEEKRKALRSVLEDKKLPFSVRHSILQYSAQCQKFEGIVRSMRNRRGEDTVNDKQNDNYERGYAAKPQEMAAIKDAYTSAQEALCKAYDMPLEALETLNMEAIEHAARSGKDAKTKQAALDYLTAKAAYTGMIEHIHDDIKDAQDYHEAMIDNRTDETGNIQQITLKEKDANGGNQQMYLTKGKVVMTDDGTMVNVQASDKSLTVVDGQGRAKLISPKDIFRVDAPVKAEEEKKNVLSGISQEKSQRYADIIDGVTDAEGNPIANNTSTESAENTENTETSENTESTESAPVMPKVGETVELTDAEGNKTPITVQAVNADGYEVTDGNRVWVMPADEMQKAVTPKVENTQTNGAENTTETATDGTETKTALERIPTDEKTGEPMFEKADKATALDALNEMTQGNEEASEAIVNAQVAQAQKALDELKKKKPTRKAAVLKGTPMEMLQAQQKAEADYKASMEQYNNMVAEAEEKAKAWASIAEEMNNRKQAAVAQQEAERQAEAEAKQKAAEEQKKADVETRQPEPAENQTEQAENKTEQEQVARSKSETEEEPQPASKGANEESGLTQRDSSNQEKTKKSARTEGSQTERKPLSKRTQKACEAVADALGVDIEWVDHLDANGEYEQRGKNGRAVIRIARDAENPLSTVFGHEGVHAVRDLSEEAYQSLIAAARAVVGEEEWRNRHIAIRNRYKKYHLSKAGVTEEVVADIVGEMITDRNMAEQIAYRLDHPTLSALRDIARKLWEAVKKLAGNGELTEQEQAVKDFADTIERAFADASAVYKGEGQIPSLKGMAIRLKQTFGNFTPQAMPIGRGVLTGDADAPIRYSIRQIISGVGMTVNIGTDGKVTLAIGNRTFDKEHHLQAEDIMSIDSPLTRLVDKCVEIGSLEDADVVYEKYTDFLNAILDKGDQGFEYLSSQWAWAGEALYKSVSKNSDDQYAKSVDITRVCKKNEAVINAICELQLQQQYGVTPGQILDLYNASIEEGFQVPCPVCYVFSRYIQNGQYASALMQGKKLYGHLIKNTRNMTEKERKQYVQGWLDEIAAIKEWQSVHQKEITEAKRNLSTILQAVDVLSKDITSGKLKGEAKTNAEKRIEAMSRLYQKSLDIVNYASLDGWITNVAIHKSGSEWVPYEDSYREGGEIYPDEVALDLRRAAEASSEYPGVERFRKSRGSAAGKAIQLAADNALGETAELLGIADPEKKDVNYSALQKAYAEASPEAREKFIKTFEERIAKARVYAAQQTLRGGIRQWSWSDNIERLSPDVFANLLQIHMLGGAVQAYSKQLEGIELVASMNGYVNGSLMGKGIGYKEVDADYTDAPKWKDEKTGKYYTLEFDNVVGIEPFSHDGKLGLFDLNSMYDRAGNILVGMDDIHVSAAMADPRIFFIIPWHASGMSNHILMQMYNYLGVPMDGLDRARDYTKVQEEKKFDETSKISDDVRDFWQNHNYNGEFRSGLGEIESGVVTESGIVLSEKQKHYRELRNALLMHNSLDENDAFWKEHQDWLKEIEADEFLSQVKKKVNDAVNVLGETMTAKDCGFVYPYEYWDVNSTYDKADVNAKRYLEYCRRMGFQPKFCGIADGKYTNYGNFADKPGYWKLLIDRRMYDTDGNYQDLTPVTIDKFTPDLCDPEKTGKRFDVTRVADEKKTKDIVARAKEIERKRGNAKTENERDKQFVPAANYDASTTAKARATAREKAAKDYAEAAKAEAKVIAEAKAIAESKKKPTVKKSLREHKADGVKTPSKREVALRDALVDIMTKNGMDMHMVDDNEGQRVLDMANEGVKLHAKLSNLAKAANVIHNWIANNSRGKVFTIELPSATQRMVRRAMGRDFDSHNITANGIAHAKKNHGESGRKLTVNSIPLRDKDFELAPYIMIAPSYVREGTFDGSGRRSIRFYKELGNGIAVVAEKEYKNSPDDMETITMWAELSSEATNAQRNAAPDTHVLNAILDTDAAKIRKDAENAIHNEEKIREQRVFYYNPRTFITPVRGGWTKKKIKRQLKDMVGSHKGYSFAAKLISEFDSPEELAEHMFYHGTYRGGGALKPSILMSDRDVELYGGGGYGEKYWGISVSRSKEIASRFSSHEGVSIFPIILAKKAKVIEMPKATDAADLEDHITDLWEQEVDAVWIGDKNKGEQELCVLNPRAIVNINSSDYYRYFRLGSEENPLHIIDKAGIEKLYKDAVRFEEQKKNAPKKPSRYNEDYSKKKDEAQYQKEVEEYESSQEYKDWEQAKSDAYRNIRFFRTANGEAYGFTVGGKIYIDPRIATSETPIHEYAHLWATALREGNPKEWANVVNLMKGTPIWDEVKERYPELKTDDDIADEVLAHYSGRRGAERLREEARKITGANGGVFEKAEALSALQRVKRALADFWKGVADMLHIHYKSAEEVADRVMKDLLDGVDPRVFANANGKLRMSEDAEMKGIVAKAKADGTYMKAPNGSKSNLLPRQWAQVRTKAFKNWFGDWENDPSNASKVVDENGEPRVVYHQTNSTVWINRETGENYEDLDWKEKDYWHNEATQEEFEDTWKEQDFYTFDNKNHGRRSVEMPAFFFAPKYDEYHEYGDRTIAAFLNIKNPAVNPDIEDRGVYNDAGEKAMQKLIDAGYDGFIRKYDGEIEEINAFYPNQIKSADENVGTFDADNSDIRYQFVGEKGAEEDADELKFRTVYGGNSGYVGYSKSKRAAEAEERGLRSVSQMDKEFADEVNRLVSEATGEESNLSLKKIRDIAKSGRYDEWHHTSMYGNRTKYYSADTIAESIVDAKEEENGREEREREMQKVKEREERLKELMTDEHDVTITVKESDGDSLDFTYDVFRSSNGYAFPVKYNLTPLKASFGIQVLNEGQDKYWGGSPFLQDSYIEDHWEEIENAVDEYNSRLAEAKEEVDTAKSSFVGEGFSESRDQSEENAMLDCVNELSERLHTPVRIIQTEEEMAQLPDSRQRRMKGSYNTRTGEVTIVVPNNANVADVENTFVHEAVGHDGLRLLFPEEGKLNHTLDELYRVSESGIRQKIDADAQKMYDAEVERIMERKRKEHEAKGENANATRYTDLAEAHVEASKKRDKFRRTATEEYAADLAGRIGEEGFERMSAEEQTFWGKLKGMLQKALDNLMQGMGIQSKHEWTDKDWAYVLHESYKRKKNGGKPSMFDMADTEAMKQKTGFGESMKAEDEVTDTDILFRDGDAHDYDKARARDAYERKMRNGWFQTVEALQDSMLSLKEAMQGVLKAEGKGKVNIEDVAGFENAYLGENRLSSVNLAEENYAKRAYIDPLMKEVARIAPTADERAELTDYMMAKHGLERNDVMAQREAEKKAREEFKNELREAEKAVAKDPLDQDAKDALDDVKQRMADRASDLYFENRGRDYAGLTALTETDNVVDAEAEAAKMVADYEQRYPNTAKLWQLVNAVNAYTLQRTRESGIISEDTYNDIKSMYHHYIPLRGFDETTSDEVYAYTPQKGNAFSSPIKTAKGRKSKADDPFANMEAMMESAIVQGNRNTLVKQKFLNFVMNHPSDLFSVSDVWLAYDQVADEWKTVQSGDVANTEKINDTDTPQEVERKMRNFEAVMEQLAKNNPNNFAKQSDEPSIPYRVVNKSDESQHQVVVMRYGKKKVITVNGNPRAAQALNGQTNPDSNQNKGFVNKTMEVGQNINRKLAGVYTSLNPDFVVSNYIRDMLYANTTVHIKENEKYALTFNGYCATLSSPAVLTSLYAKLKSGKLDEMKKNGTLKGLDASFYEFIMNGGETGFTAMKNIEKRKKDIERQIKKHAGKLPQAVAWDALNESLDFLNECIENSARFAAFLTSRKMGRTIDRSVWDAKEVSVNFNKKGAGDRFMGANGQTKIGNAASFISGAGRGLYVFWNAAIQGTANAGNIVVRHKAKSLAMMAALFGLGALTAAMGASGDGDDDYYDLPEYTRRSNIIFRFPGMKQWIAIPLSVEYRSLYGLGELASSTATGNGPTNEGDLATAIAEQTSQLLPLDFMEGGGGLHALWPSSVKPWVEASSNQSWTGQPIYKDNEYNKTMPEWTKAYKSANKYIVWASKELNEATGGNDYKKGAVDFNPSKLEYLLSGYAGGLFSFADRLVKTAETIHGDREYDARNTPFLNRVVKQGDERTKDKAVNNRYFNMKEEAAETQKLLKGYTEASHDREDRERANYYRELLRDLKQSPEYRRFKMFQREDKKVKALQEKREDARSEKQREQIDDRLAQRKRILVGRISQLKEAE